MKTNTVKCAQIRLIESMTGNVLTPVPTDLLLTQLLECVSSIKLLIMWNPRNIMMTVELASSREQMGLVRLVTRTATLALAQLNTNVIVVELECICLRMRMSIELLSNILLLQ